MPSIRLCCKEAVQSTENKLSYQCHDNWLWSHIITLIPIREPLKRSFYEQMAITEHWSVRTLREKISSQLYERTAISRKPEETIKHDIALLRDENKMDRERRIWNV